MARTCVRPVPKELDVRPLTIYGVEGHLHRRNDVVFQPALRSRAVPGARLTKQQTLVFFGGDIQNLSHLMDQSDEDINYRLWCLEAAALRLASAFPYCHVVVIKPSRVVFEHISCYDNFVESNSLGIAMHCYHYLSLMHLEKLLESISQALQQMDSDVLFNMLLRTEKEEIFQGKHEVVNGTSWQYENLSEERKRMLIKWQKKLCLHEYPLTLVAFSKGCVVLNQFLYEFHYARGLEPNHQDSRFIERIRDMYWLDSGNCGRQNIYVTSRGLLRTLALLKIHVHVHVSLYMTEDEKRPWIKKQLNEFIEGIDAAKGRVTHFRHASPTEDLKSHFRVLLQFKYLEKNGNNINSLKVRLPRKLSSGLLSGWAATGAGPAPVAPQPVQPRPRKHPSQSESIGLCLVKPHNSPHLALRMTLQKPGFTLKSNPGRVYCYHPPWNVREHVPRYHEILSSNQMSATSAQLPISAQTPPTPPVEFERISTSTSAQMPSPPAQPSLSAQMPSTPAEPTTSAQMPQTSAQMPPTSAQMPPTSAQMPQTSAQMPPTSAQMLPTSAQMPLTSAQMPPTSGQMPPTSAQMPPTPGNVWPSDLLPRNDARYTVLLLNELNYTFNNRADQIISHDLYSSESFMPVVAFPHHRNSLRVYVYSSEQETYVPTVNNHHFVVNKIQNFDLPSFLVDEEPPPAGDGLNPGHAPSNNASPRSDVSSPDSSSDGSFSDSDSDISDLDSQFSDSASDVSASDSDSSLSSGRSSPVDSRIGSSSGLADQPVLSERASGSASDVSASDSDSSLSSGRSSPVDSRIGSRSGLADHPVLSERASPRGTLIAQSDVAQNRVDTPHDRIDSLWTPPGSQVASSSRDSVAPQAGSSGARVRARDVDDELPSRYNLRKRIKRSYDENIYFSYQ